LRVPFDVSWPLSMRTPAQCFFVWIVLALSGVAPAKADITIAVAGPMSGKFAAFGKQMQIGAALAVAEVNRTNGVRGQRVRLITADDRCDATLAVKVAKEMVRRKVSMVAGHLCSRASIAAMPVYARAGIAMISPGSTHPQLTDGARRNGWRNVFRVCGRDDAQAEVIGRYLANYHRRRNIAILHDRSSYGQGLARLVRKSIRRQGVREVLFLAYRPGSGSFRSLVARMKSAKIKAVFLGGFFPEGAGIVRQAQENKFAPQFIAADAFITDEFWKFAGKAGQGTLVTLQRDPMLRPDAKRARKLARKANKILTSYGFHAFAAIEVWAAAARSAKSMRIGDVASKLRSRRFRTAIGSLRFDDKGDVRGSRYVWRIWKDGKTVPR